MTRAEYRNHQQGDMQTDVQKYYEKRAKEGYGLQHPEGHVIRLYEHVLKPLLANRLNPILFDFGCWNGTHPNYFRSKGMSVQGVDIVEAAIEQAVELMPALGKAHFKTIDNEMPIRSLFPTLDRVDVLFSNQVLYFLNEETFDRRLQEFSEMLAPDGFFVATMMTRNCFYEKYSTGFDKSTGLERIEFDSSAPERLRGKVTHVRFIESPDHLKRVFSMFPCVQMGRYECDLDLKHSTEHLIYIGRSAALNE